MKKTHKGSPRSAVSDLTLHVREGEICVFVGPSGCGKTTLLRMINRLDIQDSG
ncbi:ATP-binding cassette domain-containing protein, partial [Pseudomonas syringae group genomosp. 7]|uniref:ATP-binding cassette domain-containing protein n=1 Tax=Pseudomonas syringae group genomosp. 7 TaxID=251699 RepID=UPI00376F7A25